MGAGVSLLDAGGENWVHQYYSPQMKTLAQELNPRTLFAHLKSEMARAPAEVLRADVPALLIARLQQLNAVVEIHPELIPLVESRTAEINELVKSHMPRAPLRPLQQNVPASVERTLKPAGEPLPAELINPAAKQLVLDDATAKKSTAQIDRYAETLSIQFEGVAHAQQVMEGAVERNLPALRDCCETYLARHLSVDNWHSIYTSGQDAGAVLLQRHCLAFYLRHRADLPADQISQRRLPPADLELAKAEARIAEISLALSTNTPSPLTLLAKRSPDITFIDGKQKIQLNSQTLRLLLPNQKGLEELIARAKATSSAIPCPAGLSFLTLQAIQEWAHDGLIPVGFTCPQWLALLDAIQGSPIYEPLRRRALEGLVLPTGAEDESTISALVNRHRAWTWAAHWAQAAKPSPSLPIIRADTPKLEMQRLAQSEYLILDGVSLPRDIQFPNLKAVTAFLTEEQITEAIPHLTNLSHLAFYSRATPLGRRILPNPEQQKLLFRANPRLESLILRDKLKFPSIDESLLPQHCRLIGGEGGACDWKRLALYVPSLETIEWTPQGDDRRAGQAPPLWTRLRTVNIFGAGPSVMHQLLSPSVEQIRVLNSSWPAQLSRPSAPRLQTLISDFPSHLLSSVASAARLRHLKPLRAINPVDWKQSTQYLKGLRLVQ